ncbi:MAG: hypothetical protein KJ948_03080 [Gammaproteobacteria bacterium]|nr:hypothetical protein [Gammaproteobacteria bacterium]
MRLFPKNYIQGGPDSRMATPGNETNNSGESRGSPPTPDSHLARSQAQTANQMVRSLQPRQIGDQQFRNNSTQQSDESTSLRKTRSMDGMQSYRGRNNSGSMSPVGWPPRSSQSSAFTRLHSPHASSQALSLAQTVSVEEVKTRVLELSEINDEKNTITRSSAGKTTGVFLLTDPTVGIVKAALKPVTDKEILANQLFEVLGMPIPLFDVWDTDQICASVRGYIENSSDKQLISAKHEKTMAMQAVMGRTLSECAPPAIKQFLTNKNNLHFLGRSMAFDLLIGNADRIFYFSAPVVNPDNIIVKDNQAFFIDQVFNAKDSSRWKHFYSALLKSKNATIDDKTCIYNKYIFPLVEKSLKKYTENPSQNNEQSSTQDLISEFNHSINNEMKREIILDLWKGIESAMNDLIEKKEQVINILENHNDIKKYITSIYALLNTEHFKEFTYD